jgi:hypothetical protein
VKLTESPDLRLLTTQVNASLLQEANEAYARGAGHAHVESGKLQRSLGPAAATLADHASADGLVFAEIEAFKTSGEIAGDMASSFMQGMVSLGTVVPVYPTKGALLLVAIVDGPSGDVLWQNVAATENVDFTAPGVVEGMVIFAKLPGDAAPTNSDATRMAAARAAVAASVDTPPRDASTAKEGVR